MGREYHCLIAGLPEVFFEIQKLVYPVTYFREYLKEELTDEDYKLIESYFWRFDNENLLNFFLKNNKPYITAANLTREELEELVKSIKEDSINSFSREVPEYLIKIIEEYLSGNLNTEEENKVEKRITEEYYNFVCGISNKFISNWYNFELNLNNLLSALNCRKYNIDRHNHIIGNNEIAQKLITSNARDFGINEFPFYDEILKNFEESNLLEREKNIDKIKWNYLDNEVFFFYFTVERIFSYLIKLTIIERWLNLDYNTGKQLFQKLINELEKSYSFPEDFKLKH